LFSWNSTSWVFFEHRSRKFQVLLKCDNINGYLTWRYRVCTFMTVSSWSLLTRRMRNVTDESRGNQNTHFVNLWDPISYAHYLYLICTKFGLKMAVITAETCRHALTKIWLVL